MDRPWVGFAIRWAISLLAFPFGGLMAGYAIGPMNDVLSALVGGAIVGALLGLLQWFALRARGIGWTWIPGTALALAIGSDLGGIVTGWQTDIASLVLLGMIQGATVGLVQGLLLLPVTSRGAAVAWPVLLALSWGAAWAITAAVGVDVERQYVVFGASGAFLVTLVTGLALGWMTKPVQPVNPPPKAKPRPGKGSR